MYICIFIYIYIFIYLLIYIDVYVCFLCFYLSMRISINMYIYTFMIGSLWKLAELVKCRYFRKCRCQGLHLEQIKTLFWVIRLCYHLYLYPADRPCCCRHLHPYGSRAIDMGAQRFPGTSAK